MRREKILWGTVSDLKAVQKPVLARQPMGHTAYHHVGALGSSPYYQFAGMRQRSPGINWNAGAGGVLPGRTGAQELGAHEIPNLLEMTLGPDTIHTPAFRRTSLHRRFPRHEALFGCMGDWPLVYPKGPEAPDPNQDSASPYLFTDARTVPPGPSTLAGILDLSDNEKILALAGAAALGWWLWKRSKKRGRRRNPNPARARYEVFAGKPGRYAMSFSTKASAKTYAQALRRSGTAARVQRSR